MPSRSDDHVSRRRFLQFAAASPLVAVAGVDISRLAKLFSGGPRDQAKGLAILQQATQEPELIAAAADALDVFDFEPVATKKLPPAHWGYLATGTDDDATIRANREGYAHWDLRARRLVDVSKIDPSVEILGVRWPTPIVINPVGSQKAFHPEGEVAVARAAKAKNHLQVLSTVATTSIEDCIAARGAPVWFQLYHHEDWNQTKQMVKRAEHAGAPVVVFTVDLIGGSNRETMVRSRATDTRTCTNCHLGGAPMPGATGRVNELRDNRRKPAIADLKPDTPSPEVGTPTWDWVKRLQDSTSMKVFIKGIVTREDAELAMHQGINGIFVSNHGGRAENSTRATVLTLPEVVAGVRGRAPVFLDGGIRRGTDIFKGLALGATATGIGQPYIWGLASFGQEGVETVLAILRKEIEMTMRQMGTTSVKKISREHLIVHGT
ncbi:MAG TPA: alpha-hydroxy acid oxidase [Vicinamibacterales bacterium]|nr:alpha-hydroxy acid oxidase [Vicinamibacterales bacterium]